MGEYGGGGSWQQSPPKLLKKSELISNPALAAGDVWTPLALTAPGALKFLKFVTGISGFTSGESSNVALVEIVIDSVVAYSKSLSTGSSDQKSIIGAWVNASNDYSFDRIAFNTLEIRVTPSGGSVGETAAARLQLNLDYEVY